MNSLDPETRARVIMALIEGNSIASTSRMTGAAKMTVLKLLRDVGAACQRFHDAHVRYLGTVRVQCDEVWSFCYSKQKNVPERFKDRTGYGSIWTWTALDADSKLMISWVVSNRNQEAADALIRDLKSTPRDSLPSALQANPSLRSTERALYVRRRRASSKAVSRAIRTVR